MAGLVCSGSSHAVVVVPCVRQCGVQQHVQNVNHDVTTCWHSTSMQVSDAEFAILKEKLDELEAKLLGVHTEAMLRIAKGGRWSLQEEANANAARTLLKDIDERIQINAAAASEAASQAASSSHEPAAAAAKAAPNAGPTLFTVSVSINSSASGASP